jgi:anti-sigma regulatory factor (Ser/Thr protein kinase)
MLPSDCDMPLPPPPSDAEALSYSTDLHRVRRFVASRAREAGLSALRSADLILAVSELAANTLRHTGAPGMLQLWRTRREIVCQISDSGEIRDRRASRSRPALGGGGLGLWIVHEICDSVEIRTGPGGSIIRVHMKIPSQ